MTAVRFAAVRVSAISVLARVRSTRGNRPTIKNYRRYFSFQREKIATGAARPRKDGRGELVNTADKVPLGRGLPEKALRV